MKPKTILKKKKSHAVFLIFWIRSFKHFKSWVRGCNFTCFSFTIQNVYEVFIKIHPFFSEFYDPNLTSWLASSTFFFHNFISNLLIVTQWHLFYWCQMYYFFLRSVSLNLLLLRITFHYPFQITFFVSIF